MNDQMKITFMSVKKMEKMRAIFLLMSFFGFTAASFGQEKSNKETVEVYQSLSSTEIAKYRNYDFKDNFAVLLESDKTSNYFFLDLSKMASTFELKYFLYLAYQSGNGVQISHGLSQDRGWFIVDGKRSERDALKQILKLKQNAAEKNKALTESEKKDWIKLKNY